MTPRAKVVIAGGGFAALEAALALRVLAEDRVELTLISDRPGFHYRPAATAEAFSDQAPLTYDLREIARDLGARFSRSGVEAVMSPERAVRLESGETVDYDVLVLATGALSIAAVPGALTFRDQRDVPRFRVILDQLEAGRLNRLVVAVPSNHCWPLPAYELALLSSFHALRHSVEAQIAIVTPEAEPLALFGAPASRRLSELLAEREIRFVGKATPHSVGHDGALALEFDAPIPAERVVAVPELHAARIAGVPSSWSGFVPTDSEGRVDGLASVYAAGDLTTFPVKQGGIAAQQADRVAQAIAADLGAEVKEIHDARVLLARLLTGDGALVLRTELDALGRPTAASLEHHESRQAENLKVFGRYLTPYLSMYGSRLRAKTAAA